MLKFELFKAEGEALFLLAEFFGSSGVGGLT